MVFVGFDISKTMQPTHCVTIEQDYRKSLDANRPVYHLRAAPATGTAANRVSVPFHFGRRQPNSDVGPITTLHYTLPL